MSDTEVILSQIIGQLRGVVAPGIEIRPESTIVGDLGLDSLSVMNFVMSLEDTFDVSLTMDDLARVETVADLAQALNTLTAKVQ